MQIVDRTRDALRPANTIQALPPHVWQPTGEVQSPSSASAMGPAVPSSTPAPAAASEFDKRPTAPAADPESITRTYYVQTHGRERRYYDDYKGSALAIQATNTAISSKRQDLNTVRAMLELARARNWQSLEVRGSAEFKREMWIEATARGLPARGHLVSDLDRQEAERRRKEREPANPARTPINTPQRQAVPTASGMPHDTTSPASTAASRDQAANANASTPQERSRAAHIDPAVGVHHQTMRPTDAVLSQDGRLLLAALSEKIDRQMSRHDNETKAELKAFVVAQLVKKERSEGPIVLSAEHKRAASAAEPVKGPPAPVRLLEPQAPQRSLSR